MGPTTQGVSSSSPSPSEVVAAYVPTTRWGREGPQPRHRRVRRPLGGGSRSADDFWLRDSRPRPRRVRRPRWWWQPSGRRVWHRRVRRQVWWWQPLADDLLSSSPSPEVGVAACGADELVDVRVSAASSSSPSPRVVVAAFWPTKLRPLLKIGSVASSATQQFQQQQIGSYWL